MKYRHEELLTIRSYKELKDKHPFIYNKIIEERARQLKKEGIYNKTKLETYPTNMIAGLFEGGFVFNNCETSEEIYMWEVYLQPLENSNISGDYNKVYEYFNTFYKNEYNPVTISTIKNRLSQIKF